jgi:hypothetical protein
LLHAGDAPLLPDPGQAIRYFEELWSRSLPIQPLLERIQRGIEESSARIDYPTIWLARYDYGLPEEDKVLKTAELGLVKAELQRLNRWGETRHYLDVGTCTARYPLALRDAVRPDGEILGIDVEPGLRAVRALEPAAAVRG